MISRWRRWSSDDLKGGQEGLDFKLTHYAAVPRLDTFCCVVAAVATMSEDDKKQEEIRETRAERACIKAKLTRVREALRTAHVGIDRMVDGTLPIDSDSMRRTFHQYPNRSDVEQTLGELAAINGRIAELEGLERQMFDGE